MLVCFSRKTKFLGGGLSGLSAAHTVLERGGKVLLLDKNPFCGGNSVKATSGINGTLTRTQRKLKVQDSVETFEEDTALSASKGQSKEIYPLGKVLCNESGPAVDWLVDAFGLDLSIVSRLGGHSFPRTHRGPERFPGMTITYALMEKLEKIASDSKGELAQIITKAKATKLITKNGAVVGVEYEKDGKTLQAHGPVVLATGGYAADFSKDGILLSVRPDLERFSTTNGEHCTGDGIKMATAIGAEVDDLSLVQVHPTGLVNPKDPNAKVKFLAAEALRGVGGLLLDGNGKRFCNELGRRDYVSGEMEKGKGPFRLVLSSAASKQIEWHCKHYQGRGLMKHFKSGAELAKEIGVSTDTISATFKKYNECAKNKSDEFGTKYFLDTPYKLDDTFYVAIVTPVVHYCMGGLKISTSAEVLDKSGKAIPGLFATGELCGGVHGKNRLGGSSLLDCVVFGRVSGGAVSKYLLQNGGSSSSSNNGFSVKFSPNKSKLSLLWGSSSEKESTSYVHTTTKDSKEEKDMTQMGSSETTVQSKGPKSYTLEEVAKHTKDTDVWVVVNGQVLDVTSFLSEHPGGKDSIMLFAGKDASEEFNMIHKPEVIAKYAPQAIIGTLAGSSVSHSKTSGRRLLSKL